MTLEIDRITKSFDGDAAVLNEVSLTVKDGEFLALLGPSGSGKTTLLNLIAGLTKPDGGTLRLDGDDITTRPAGARRFGMVFQSYALFRHMTVADNIGFGLRVLKGKDRPTKPARRARVAELLDLIEMPDLGDRYPAQLSGGQQQRVAMARALAISPRLLLLDEPFSALDAQVRRNLRGSVRDLQQKVGVTAILVTHDQAEAFEIADRVAVMNGGIIEQVGTPADLAERPSSDFVRDFIGAA
ncbi:sulfate transport system ATP-binding protein [Palleronia marisminoris]|uniref:Sulfate/thiosulfate import ATP-binding protein CysA n=1 Tax=Palleronia marisminoris TaxID=315423 RepID=A0A1Y5RKS9_9RHOB|nr:ABC transporter ATP-binding protein [Palleronia marisminoris]SFG25455.1 sulfate transport system ATP-binding protein [Palleronia marisminoris]SLN19826.1 Sulfate/thiosulfate import ATP-binding protein CysA [Palleronia marisminoris]